MFYSAHRCITAGYIRKDFRWNTDIKPCNFGTCKVKKGNTHAMLIHQH